MPPEIQFQYLNTQLSELLYRKYFDGSNHIEKKQVKLVLGGRYNLSVAPVNIQHKTCSLKYVIRHLLRP